MKNRETYQERKKRARQEAIEWQRAPSEEAASWEDVLEVSTYFEHIGRKYGLLREFRENAII